MKMTMPKIIGEKIIRPLPVGVTFAILTISLLGYRLFSLIPHSTDENPHSLGFATVEEIRNSALFAPFKGLGIVLLKITDNDVYTRLAAALIAFCSAALLYVMLRKWYTHRISGLTILLFITSSWFLHQGRITNTEVMYLAVTPILLLACMWLLSKKHERKLPLAAILLGLALYVPGTWLFIVAGLIFFRRFTVQNIRKLSTRMKLLCSSLLLLTVAPLIYSFTVAQKQIITWLGYDQDQTFTAVEIARNFVDMPKQLFVYGPDNPMMWLGHTPVFDIFSIAILILGFYAFYAGYYPAREKLIYGMIIIAVLLIGIGNVASLSLLIPLLYIVMANGLAYLLQSWFTVFPRNPVARSIGVGLICIVIGLSCFYQLRRYFIAWPRADATQSQITHQ